ncbi:ABC transporter ATP-binding protein [Rhodoplanes serenus]|uniref:ABC transporter ATP-binding protein n=1 Tax=Rhodoplanes serenus TaxID=200615 RepID=UPI001AEEFCF4|nr:ABC transporter ATP-binding protein [Rhodoplanes serenus]
MVDIPKRELQQRLDEIAAFCGLGEFPPMSHLTYSTGMQLRLAFSVSTTISPEVLILGEWLASGDIDFDERANQRLKKVVDAPDILVPASHSYERLRANCRRLIWLEHARVRIDEPFDGLRRIFSRRSPVISLILTPPSR